MRIAIMGCGAMGTVLGAYLSKNGCALDMIDSYEAHVDAMNAKGAQITGMAEFTVPVNAITPDQMTGIYDVVFLLTKQTANGEVLPRLLSHLDENSTVCTLQNGVPEVYVAEHVGKNRTVGGTILWGATFVEPGVSMLTQDITKNDFLFEVGEIDGAVTPRIQKIADVLSLMGSTSISEQLMDHRWGKLVNNACMSGMSAVCGCTFGEVLADGKARACLSYLGNEVKLCCEADGHILPELVFGFAPDSLAIKDQAQYEANQQMFVSMYSVALGGKASMLQDLEKGQTTEVNMINGFVSQTGIKRKVPTPFNDTVVSIVNRIEKGDLTPSLDNLRFFEDSWFRYGVPEK